MSPKFHHERLFRETEGVHFSDVWVPGQNGLDLVVHRSRAVSPPSQGGVPHFYIHSHQTDHNRVIQGRRVFELIYGGWSKIRWYVMLTPETGALEIPPGCYHRSVSCSEGSILLNHAVRDEEYDETKEFFPSVVHTRTMHRPWYAGATKEEIIKFLQNNGDDTF